MPEWAAVLVTGGGPGSARGSREAVPAVDVIDGVHLVPCEPPHAFAEYLASLAVRRLVVVVPEGLRARADLGLALATGRTPDLLVARTDSRHAPLGLLAALSSAHVVAQEPGLAVDYVRSYLGASWTACWADRLTGLSWPAPTLAQHARSLIPGTGFLVRLGPHGRVLNDLRDPGVPAASMPRLLRVAEPGLPADLVRSLADVTGAVGAKPARLPGDWTFVTGRRGAVQVALVPLEPGQVHVPEASPCPSCAALTSSPACPFCHLLVHGSEVVGGLR